MGAVTSSAGVKQSSNLFDCSSIELPTDSALAKRIIVHPVLDEEMEQDPYDSRAIVRTFSQDSSHPSVQLHFSPLAKRQCSLDSSADGQESVNATTKSLAQSPVRLLGRRVRNYESPQVKAVKAATAHSNEDADQAIDMSMNSSVSTEDRLLQAARTADVAGIQNAIEAGINANCRSSRGHTPLMRVAGSSSKNSPQAMHSLLDARADVKLEDERGWTALMHACVNNCRAAVEILLEQGLDVNLTAVDGKTPLILAAAEAENTLDSVKLLAKAKAELGTLDQDGYSAFFYACQKGKRDLVKWFLTKGVDVNTPSPDGLVALMILARTGDIKTAKVLLRKPVDLDARHAKSGNTALIESILNSNISFAQLLVDENASLIIANKRKKCAIQIAAEAGFSVFKSALEYKARKQGHDPSAWGFEEGDDLPVVRKRRSLGKADAIFDLANDAGKRGGG